jgi:phosphatidylglycerol:prolipoprotein diacylglycerol transferase
LEGIGVFLVVYLYRKYQRFSGELLLVYGFSYGIFRFLAEIYRAPDAHIGYICCDTITQGQVMSLGMSVLALALWFYYDKKEKRKL